MRNAVNILLLVSMLFGIGMMIYTPWALVFTLGPLVIWIMIWIVELLTFVHKNLWSSLIFWAGVAYLNWKVALGMFAFLVIFRFIRVVLIDMLQSDINSYSPFIQVRGPISPDFKERSRWP